MWPMTPTYTVELFPPVHAELLALMETGREYTERWHHQMQIREAVGAPGLLERRWYQPVLDLSVRAVVV
jgi:hypothetical protein